MGVLAPRLRTLGGPLVNDLGSTHFAWNSNTAVYSSLCTQTNLRVTYSGQTGRWSESTLILTNQSQSQITRLIRVDQSQASKLVTEDEQTKVTYMALGSRQSQKS
jgi:hypothetical protein